MDETQKEPKSESPACDIYIAYADADEDVAKALQSELFRLRPGTRIWREKQRIDAGDAFNQTSDTAIAEAGIVLALWTPHAKRTRAFAVETRRALTLRKPLINVLTGVTANGLAPPYGDLPAFDVESIHRLAGRKTGWLPPMRPNRSEIEDDLKPLLDAVDDLLSDDRTAGAEIADALIANISEAAGDPKTKEFEAVLKSVAVGDPATAIEVLAGSGYAEADINDLIAPQSVAMANPSEDRPNWGAWRIVPQIVQVEKAPNDNGLFAAAGFIAAALAGGILWLLMSTLGNTGDDRTSVVASNGQSVQPASATNINGAPSTQLRACSVAPDGAINNVPCQVVESVAPVDIAPIEFGSEATIQACDIESDGSIINTPCAMRVRYTPPPPDPTRFSDLMETCQVGTDGAIENAPCALNSPVEAIEPEPVDIASLIDTCEVGGDGAIANAPCRLISPLAAPEPRTVEVEVPGETVVERVVEKAAIDDCAFPRAGAALSGDCRLTREITVAHRTCNDTFSNVPCTATSEPRRITSAAAPAPSFIDLPPISVSDDIEPCELTRTAPCRVTIAKTGLDTLTELANHYYGNANGYCRIFRANEEVFGTRADPKRPGDPNCIYVEDVLNIPGPPSNGRFETRACPPTRATNLCLKPD